MTVPKQHNVKEKSKDIDADRHGLCWTFRDGKYLVANKMDVEGTICQHFNIRGYVARAREVNENICWPFPQHLLESRTKEEGNLTLPPLEVRQFRWWNCRKCVDGTKTFSQRVVEKKKINKICNSSQECDGHSQYLMFRRQMSRAHANVQKENALNCGEMAEHLTVELKSNNSMCSSECETDKNNRDERVVTKETMELSRNEIIASTSFQDGNSETAHSREKKNGVTHNPSKFEGNANTSEKHEHEKVGEKGSAEKVQTQVQKISSILEGEVDKRLELKVNKSDAFHNLNHASNSWEYFSRNKNIFEQISKNIREKKIQHDVTHGLSLISENCAVNLPGLESNRPENIRIASVTTSFDEYVHLGQPILANENNTERVLEQVTVQTLESSIKEGDRSFGASDARNDVQCINSMENSDFVHKDKSNCVEGQECLDLPTNQGSLDTGNDLISKQMEKLNANESRCKKKSRKKRSIADIIASDSVPESWNKETEELNSADAMEENICRADNHEQFQVQEDGMKDTKDAGTSLPKSRIERTSISEVHRTTGIKNVKRKKLRPEKPKVKKKQQGLEIQSCNTCSTSEKDSSNTRKREVLSNMIHLPEDASNLVCAPKEKVIQDNSIQLEDQQKKQRCSEMDDDIPMDVVELMARNQRERSLSKPQKIHKRKRDDSGVKAKVKETNVSRANKHIKRGGTDIKKVTVKPVKRGGRDAKKGAAKPKSLEQFKPINQANLQANLKTHPRTSAARDDSQVRVSQMSSTGHSFISDMEIITSGFCNDPSAMMQSPQWLNPCRKYSNSLIPMLSGTNVACNLPPLTVNSPNSNVVVSGSVQEGACCTRDTAPASQQLTGASKDSAHMQINNMFSGGTNSFLEYKSPVFSKFYNNPEPSLYFTGECSAITSTQNLRNTEIPKLTSGNSDLDPGQNSNIYFQNHKGKAISNLLVKPDGVFFPPFYKGQSNSALLQQVNAQARPIFGNKLPVPVSSSPVLRLMGQSVSVPVNCGIEQNIVAENKDRTFSELLQASSRNHVTWLHPLTCASSGITYEDRMFRIYGPTEDSMSVKEQPQKSKTTVPPVPKFNSDHLVSNGHSETSSSSCTVPSKADFVLESSIANKQFPFQGASLFLMQQKNDLQCINPDNRHLQTFCTLPSTSQATEFVKGASRKKGIRSYRPSPTNAHPNKYHIEAAHIYRHNRDHSKSSLFLGTNPKQSQIESSSNLGTIPKESLAEEPEAARNSSPIKENDNCTLFGKSSCSTEICTLNQNPAEIIIDDGEHRDSFGYEHLVPLTKAVSHSKGREDIQIPNGQKRRRTLKKKHLQEFLSQKNGQASDLTNTNVGTARQEITNVKQMARNSS